MSARAGCIERSQAKSLELFRRRLTGIEGKHTQRYYQQVFGLFPEKLRPESRETFMAADGYLARAVKKGLL